MVLFWLNVKATLEDIGYAIADFFKRILFAIGVFFASVYLLVRELLYGLVCVAYRIGRVAFLISFYFIYKCWCEFRQGVGFADMKNLSYALWFFFLPIGIAVLKEIVRPKE